MNYYWCIPSKEDVDFVACMEDVLDVYEIPYNPAHFVVCIDEKPYQLLGDVRKSLGGRHHVSVHEQRTAIDWAQEIKYLSDVLFPDAEKIILVMDNLNTHKAASRYKAFLPSEARRIIRRLEIHYTQTWELAGHG